MPSVAVPTKRSNEEIAVLLDEIQDKERRKLNVVVHNLEETAGATQAERVEGDGARFRTMVKEALKLVVNTGKTFRVGKKEDGKPRLLIVSLTNMEDKREILRYAATLRNTDWSKVYITPDLTWQEREKGRQLRAELARRREAGEDNICIRQGRIVPMPGEKPWSQAQSQGKFGNQHSTAGEPLSNPQRKDTQNVSPSPSQRAASERTQEAGGDGEQPTISHHH